MKKFIAIALLAASAALSAAPANAQMSALKSFDAGAAATTESAIVHKTGRKGRFAAGLAIGIIGAGIASHAYHHNRYYSPRYSYERRCRRWLRQCNRGYGYSCRKYDRRC